MSATLIEKVIVGSVIVLIITIVSSVVFTINMISDAGGVRAIVVEAGKDIKGIAKEISED